MSACALVPMNRTNGKVSGRTAAMTQATAMTARREGARRATDGEQRDERERRDVEHVPLLDALDRRLGGEGRDLRDQKDAHRQARRRRTPGPQAAANGADSQSTSNAANGITPRYRSSSATCQSRNLATSRAE